MQPERSWARRWEVGLGGASPGSVSHSQGSKTDGSEESMRGVGAEGPESVDGHLCWGPSGLET